MIKSINKILKLLFVPFVCGLILVGCAAQTIQKAADAQFYLDRGKQYMERKDYIKAQADFQTVIESYPASMLVDQAQFWLAEAHYSNEDYVTAAYEYDRVYKDYPSSRHAEEAQYKRAMCYYHESPKAPLDQKNTQLAIDEFNRFISNYPRSKFLDDANARIQELRNKLALKEYKNAETYRKLKQYDAAMQYYRYVINDYPRSVWADESQYGIGLVQLKLENYERAREVFERLVSLNVSDELKEKASKKLAYIENKTN